MNSIRTAPSLLALALLSSCIGLGDFDRAKEDFHYSYPFEPGGHLDVDNTNGSVQIAGWDRATIDVSGTKFASTADRLQQVKINVKVDHNNASITTEWPSSSWNGSFGAKYLIRVPRETAIGLAQTRNGSVSAEDLKGGGRLTSTNGRISLARDDGNYNAETTNGTVEIEECSGVERARTTNGAVRGRLKTGAINAQTTNGGIDFTILQPADGQTIHVSTTNGSVSVGLAEFHNNPVSADTTHGSVTIRLPKDVNAKLALETTLASITNDLSLSSTEESSKHRLAGQVGTGGPLISATTSTGGIHVERY